MRMLVAELKARQQKSALGGGDAARAKHLARGKILPRDIARPREGKNIAALRACDLGDDVRGRAEAVESDTPALAGHPQRTPADEARAQQRRGGDITPPFRQHEHEARVGDRRGRGYIR